VWTQDATVAAAYRVDAQRWAELFDELLDTIEARFGRPEHRRSRGHLGLRLKPGWRSTPGSRSWAGVLIAAGLPVLVAALVRFAREGIGAPAPVAPTEHVVVGGLYRYDANPMYLAVTALIVGQALLLSACQPETGCAKLTPWHRPLVCFG
jgi:hypothetical protein